MLNDLQLSTNLLINELVTSNNIIIVPLGTYPINMFKQYQTTISRLHKNNVN